MGAFGTKEFWLGVASSVAASTIVYIVVTAYKFLGGGVRMVLRDWKLAHAIKQAGIKKVFTERAEYVRDPDHGSISTYIQRAEKSLVYVGFWLSHGVEDADIAVAIEAMANRGCKITLALLDPDIDGTYRTALARYFGITEAAFSSRLGGAWQQLGERRNKMSETARNNFTMVRHRELLTSSAFVIDAHLAKARTLVDVKFFRAPREKTMGIEFRLGSPEAELYKRVTDSLLEVVKSANAAGQ